MGHLSAKDEAFVATAERWLAEQGEVAVLVSYSHAAGAKSFEFFDAAPALAERLAHLPPRTLVTVYRGRQLPLRGRVDEAFIEAAAGHLPPKAEYLVAGLDPVTYGGHSHLRFYAGEGQADLRADLGDLAGERVAVGAYPADEPGVSATVPEADGTVVRGVY